MKLSFTSLKAHKSRAFLTMLGIIIGITSVIIIDSVGAGAQSLIFNQVKGIGSNLVGVLPGHREEDEPPAAAFGISITTLKYDDALALVDNENVPHSVAATAYLRGVGTINYKNKNLDASYTGVGHQFLNVEAAEIDEGDFFTLNDERSLGRVAVLGSDVKEGLFGDRNPVGEYIKIKQTNFKVIGYLKPRGNAQFQNQDLQLFIPITTAQKIMLGVNHVGFIRVKVDKSENIKRTMSDVESALRVRHGIKDPSDDDFFVGSQDMVLDTLSMITDILKYLLIAVGGISLIVGGIGIMNIMFVSVNERTREIGLRKAIGARRSDILSQFLVEAINITVIAGVLGILLGMGISGLVALGANLLGYDWDFVISIYAIIISVLFCGMIGISFGYFPAKRASALNPIEALRYE